MKQTSSVFYNKLAAALKDKPVGYEIVVTRTIGYDISLMCGRVRMGLQTRGIKISTHIQDLDTVLIEKSDFVLVIPEDA